MLKPNAGDKVDTWQASTVLERTSLFKVSPSKLFLQFLFSCLTEVSFLSCISFCRAFVLQILQQNYHTSLFSMLLPLKRFARCLYAEQVRLVSTKAERSHVGGGSASQGGVASQGGQPASGGQLEGSVSQGVWGGGVLHDNDTCMTP